MLLIREINSKFSNFPSDMLCVRFVQNSSLFAEKFNIFQNLSFFFVAELINIIFDGTSASFPIEIELYFIFQSFIIIIYHIRYESISNHLYPNYATEIGEK